MINTLSQIAEKLNKEGIVWGVGASLLLNHYGLIDHPNDIDILVSVADIQKADKVLSIMGEKKIRDKVDTYSTRYFYEYTINEFDVDVMAGLRINYDKGVFEYIFDKKSVVNTKEVGEISIPLTSLEDWYIIYQIIPGRESKVKIIESYLLSKGVKNPKLFERALESNIPNKVRKSIQGILKL